MFPYLPHTGDEIATMLASIGAGSIDELFADIPEAIRRKSSLKLRPGAAEYEVFTEHAALASRNGTEAVSFLGCGVYDHLTPATVAHLSGRAEFASAYTPYQAEMSQGMLQAIFEFQTMMCRLTGLDVSNASLYDGHTAAAEAAAIALNSVKKADTVLISATVHPATLAVVRTYYEDMGVQIDTIPAEGGVTDMKALEEHLTGSVAGVILQSPNVYGLLEPLKGVAEKIHANGSLFIHSANPLSLGVCRSPKEWGADIAVGDCQPLGLSPNFGGPSAGFITAGEKLLRKMPGRISGMTVDTDGRRGYVLTLQAREQHIKRQRATSNICSNQALAALAATIHLSTLGQAGFKETALRNLNNAAWAFARLTAIPGVEAAFEGHFFNEFTLALPANAEETVRQAAAEGYFAGVPETRIRPEGDPKRLIVAVTEKRTAAEIESLARVLREVLA